MDTVIRVVVVYLFLLAAFRLLGKREFGQLSPLEFVCLLMIPEVLQQALVREDFSMTNALVAVSTLFVLVFVTSLVSHRWKKVDDVLQGAPSVLVSNGRMHLRTMDQERVTPEEVFTEMRRSGIDRLERVRFAVLEPDGHISVVAHEPPQARSAQLD